MGLDRSYSGTLIQFQCSSMQHSSWFKAQPFLCRRDCLYRVYRSSSVFPCSRLIVKILWSESYKPDLSTFQTKLSSTQNQLFLFPFPLLPIPLSFSLPQSLSLSLASLMGFGIQAIVTLCVLIKVKTPVIANQLLNFSGLMS